MSSYLSAANLEPPFLSSANTSRSSSPATRYTGALVFGYGTNLWHHQVLRRCPSAKFIGIGRLRHWTWQINECGHANVTELPATPYDSATLAWLGPLGAGQRESNQRVYGMVYNMSEEDEAKLDSYQDVPESYSKKWQWAELWERPEGHIGKIDISRKPRRAKVLFYADAEHTTKSPTACIPELAYKIQQGILDALDQGIPPKYIDECIRPFLPPVEDTANQIKTAIQYAILHGVDVRKLVEQVEDELVQAGARKDSIQPTYGKEAVQELVHRMASENKNKNTPNGDSEGNLPNGFSSTS
jgi:hypothetical protein